MIDNENTKLIFVYNAKSGKVQGYIDMLHKIISPKTYPCKLCDITYGITTENERWKEFRKTSTIDMEFLHSDEFKEVYGKATTSRFVLPVVLEDISGNLEERISSENFKEIDSSEALIKRILILDKE